ncbi:MAG: hypothetical protein V3U60_04250 [Gammaproteobacteria bacterium]
MGTDFLLSADGGRLAFSDRRPFLTSLEEVNATLANIGSRVWPLDLGSAPTEMQRVLKQPTLTDSGVERVKEYFLMPRERLLEIITDAGREPRVLNGGALTTSVSPHAYSYPQVFVVPDDVKYSRFDRFHANVADATLG